jgi:hypothetical protein
MSGLVVLVMAAAVLVMLRMLGVMLGVSLAVRPGELGVLLGPRL